ncbi:MAG: LytR C-terminal domain-containing protein, partial [Anaerolineae bacterium]
GNNNHKRVPSESAQIEVLNGAGVPGLAAQMAALLKEQGFEVVAIENADRSDYAETLIIDYADNTQTVALLAQLLNVAERNIRKEPGGQIGAGNLRIIVGRDFVVPTP